MKSVLALIAMAMLAGCAVPTTAEQFVEQAKYCKRALNLPLDCPPPLTRMSDEQIARISEARMRMEEQDREADIIMGATELGAGAYLLGQSQPQTIVVQPPLQGFRWQSPGMPSGGLYQEYYH